MFSREPWVRGVSWEGLEGGAGVLELWSCGSFDVRWRCWSVKGGVMGSRTIVVEFLLVIPDRIVWRRANCLMKVADSLEARQRWRRAPEVCA